MTPFMIICYACMAVMGAGLIATLVLVLRVGKETSKAVLADAVFYPMVAIYLVWTLFNDSSIAYEIVLLAALLGLLSTVSLARIISRGRR